MAVARFRYKHLVAKLRVLEARIAWWVLVKATRFWVIRHLDQWERVKFEVSFGTAYLALDRSVEYPDSFEPIDANGRALPWPLAAASDDAGTA